MSGGIGRVIKAQRPGDVESYSVITAQSPAALEVFVADKMESDWEPLGGIAVVYDKRRLGLIFSQAMIRRAPRPQVNCGPPIG